VDKVTIVGFVLVPLELVVGGDVKIARDSWLVTWTRDSVFLASETTWLFQATFYVPLLALQTAVEVFVMPTLLSHGPGPFNHFVETVLAKTVCVLPHIVDDLLAQGYAIILHNI
jgi:hypothetical protein